MIKITCIKGNSFLFQILMIIYQHLRIINNLFTVIFNRSRSILKQLYLHRSQSTELFRIFSYFQQKKNKSKPPSLLNYQKYNNCKKESGWTMTTTRPVACNNVICNIVALFITWCALKKMRKASLDSLFPRLWINSPFNFIMTRAFRPSRTHDGSPV